MKFYITNKITRLYFSFDSLVLIGFILFLIIPYFYYAGGQFVAPIAIFLLWFIIIILKKNRISILINSLAKRKFEIITLLFFYLYTVFTYLFISNNSKSFQFTLIPLFYVLVIILDSYYLTVNRRIRFSVLPIIVISLGIQAGVSIPYILNSEVMVTRLLTSNNLDQVEFIDALKHGVGGTNFYSISSIIFFIGLGSLGKFQGVLKYLMLISLLLIFCGILISSFMTPLAILFLGMIVFFKSFNRAKLNKGLFGLVSIISLGVYYFFSFVLTNSVLLEPVINRLEIFQNDGITEFSRYDLANVSLDSFIDYPFFGIGVPGWGQYRVIGEHSAWLDFLAHYGIIGFSSFIIYLIYLYISNRYFFSLRTPYSSACFTGFIIYLFFNFINPIFIEGSMIFVFCFFIASIENRKAFQNL